MRKKSAKALINIENLGKRIRALRKAKGYTNADFFAYENKIDRSQYGKYERGLDMTFSSILKICEIHDISLEKYFSDSFKN